MSCNKGFQVLWNDLMQDGGGDLREGRNAEWRDSPCVRGGERGMVDGDKVLSSFRCRDLVKILLKVKGGVYPVSYTHLTLPTKA